MKQYNVNFFQFLTQHQNHSFFLDVNTCNDTISSLINSISHNRFFRLIKSFEQNRHMIHTKKNKIHKIQSFIKLLYELFGGRSNERSE